MTKLEMFKEIAKESLDVSNLTEETKLDSLGLDSLDIVEIQVAVEEKYSVRFKDANSELVTLGDFINLIE
mgnify:FL=1